MRKSIHFAQNLSDLDSIGWAKLKPVVPVILRILMAVQFFLPKQDHSSGDVQV